MRPAALYKTSVQFLALLTGAWGFRTQYVLHIDSDIALVPLRWGRPLRSPPSQRHQRTRCSLLHVRGGRQCRLVQHLRDA